MRFHSLTIGLYTLHSAKKEESSSSFDRYCITASNATKGIKEFIIFFRKSYCTIWPYLDLPFWVKDAGKGRKFWIIRGSYYTSRKKDSPCQDLLDSLTVVLDASSVRPSTLTKEDGKEILTKLSQGLSIADKYQKESA